MGNMLICAPNFAFSLINPVVYGGGDWELTDFLTNLSDEFFVNKAISVDATEAKTKFEVAFPVSRDIKLVAFPNSNVSADGRIIVEGSNTPAWVGVTITGVEGIGETTINVTATGQAYILTDQVLTIAGDTQVYQVVTGVTLGTNEIIRSEEFDNAVWTKTNLTVTADNDVAPDNLTTMDRLVETAVSANHEVTQTVAGIGIGTQHTFDIFVRAAERDKIALILDSTVFSGESVDFDLTAVLAINGSVVPDVIAITAVPGTTIFRISITATSVAAGTATLTIRVLDDTFTDSYLGDITKGLSVWGAQFVLGANELKYVKSVATAISATTGDIVIERAGVAGTGLVVATTGAEIITAQSGDYISNKIFTSGEIDYQSVIYAVGEKIWGSAGVWDGKEDPEIIQETNLPNQFLHINTNVEIIKFIRTTLKDSSNVDGFISLDGIYTTSVYRPTINMDFGAAIGTITNSSFEESAGGVIAFDTEVGQRFINFTLNNIVLNEAFVNSFDLYRRLDISESFYYIYDEDDTTLLTRRSFPALFSQLFPNVATSFNRNSVRYQIKEKLG